MKFITILHSDSHKIREAIILCEQNGLNRMHFHFSSEGLIIISDYNRLTKQDV